MISEHEKKNIEQGPYKLGVEWGKIYGREEGLGCAGTIWYPAHGEGFAAGKVIPHLLKVKICFSKSEHFFFFVAMLLQS